MPTQRVWIYSEKLHRIIGGLFTAFVPGYGRVLVFQKTERCNHLKEQDKSKKHAYLYIAFFVIVFN